MFEGFDPAAVDTGEARIRLRRGGSGPPLLLLHGRPQTHAMWHKIAPRLARRYLPGEAPDDAADAPERFVRDAGRGG